MESNEFKKSIQDNLDGLLFEPSKKVWPEVQSRLIKEKRKKRFLFFWLIAGCILTGAVVYSVLRTDIANSKNEFAITNIKTTDNNQVEQKTNSQKKINSTNSLKLQTLPLANVDDFSTNTINKIQNSTNFQKKLNQQHKEILFENTIQRFKGASKTKVRVANGKFEEDNLTTNQENENSTFVKIPPQNNVEELHTVIDKNTIPLQTDTVSTIPQKITKKLDSSKNSSSVTILPSKRKNKWQYSITLFKGKSVLKDKLSLLNSTEKRLDASSSFGVGPVVSIADSISKFNEGKSIYFGVDAEKKISKTFSFNSGLYYEYLSSFFSTGTKDTAALFFNNNNNRYLLGTSQQQKNDFHLINFQAGVKANLFETKRFSGGIGVGMNAMYLIKTNALILDTTARLYYRNESSFNKMQFAINTNLFVKYKINERFILQAGPQIQFHLTPTGKAYNYEQKYFKVWGLKANFYFNKKNK